MALQPLGQLLIYGHISAVLRNIDMILDVHNRFPLSWDLPEHTRMADLARSPVLEHSGTLEREPNFRDRTDLISQGLVD